MYFIIFFNNPVFLLFSSASP